MLDEAAVLRAGEAMAGSTVLLLVASVAAALAIVTPVAGLVAPPLLVLSVVLSRAAARAVQPHRWLSQRTPVLVAPLILFLPIGIFLDPVTFALASLVPVIWLGTCNAAAVVRLAGARRIEMADRRGRVAAALGLAGAGLTVSLIGLAWGSGESVGFVAAVAGAGLTALLQLLLLLSAANAISNPPAGEGDPSTASTASTVSAASLDVMADVDTVAPESVRCLGCDYPVGGQGERCCPECGCRSLSAVSFVAAADACHAVICLWIMAIPFALLTAVSLWFAVGCWLLLGLSGIRLGTLAVQIRGQPGAGFGLFLELGLAVGLSLPFIVFQMVVATDWSRGDWRSVPLVAGLATMLLLAAALSAPMVRLARSRGYITVMSRAIWCRRIAFAGVVVGLAGAVVEACLAGFVLVFACMIVYGSLIAASHELAVNAESA